MKESLVAGNRLAVICIRAVLVSALLMSALLKSSLLKTEANAQQITEESSPPNFLVIVADDMGWSDIGVLGGEIRTPVIDSLANAGVLLTSYYVAPTCAPTRAMLMTGVDHHQTGLGVQAGMRAPNQLGINYEGQLHNGVITVAEALANRGYQTFMSGKWHLANGEAQAPHNRGFQRSFALLNGGASHFGDQQEMTPVEVPRYMRDGLPAAELPADFYSSTSYTENMLGYLEERDENAPFFAYLAFTAPHDPLQVPDEWLDRYAGAYDDGPAATRRARAERQAALGLIPDNTKLVELSQVSRLVSESPSALVRTFRGTARAGRAPHGNLCGNGRTHGPTNRPRRRLS